MSEAEARASRFLIRYAGQVRVRAIERPDRSLRAHSRRGRDTTCRSERRLLLVAIAKTAAADGEFAGFSEQGVVGWPRRPSAEQTSTGLEDGERVAVEP